MYAQKWVILFYKAGKHYANQGVMDLTQRLIINKGWRINTGHVLLSTIILKISSVWAFGQDLKVSGRQGRTATLVRSLQIQDFPERDPVIFHPLSWGKEPFALSQRATFNLNFLPSVRELVASLGLLGVLVLGPVLSTLAEGCQFCRICTQRKPKSRMRRLSVRYWGRLNWEASQSKASLKI